MAQKNFMVSVAINCHIFIGSVHENYMKFHGLPSHFHRLFSVSSARNKLNQLETRHSVERSACSSHPVRAELIFKSPHGEPAMNKSLSRKIS